MGTDGQFGSLLEGPPVMAILRNMSPRESVTLAERAWDLGIELVEVPIQTADAVPSLEAVLHAARERGAVAGAGTVTRVEQVHEVARMGGAFTLAPGLDPRVVEAARTAGIPHVPGVATASEVQTAVALGCQVLKAFPASVLTPSWFTAMAGPFPQVSFVATGGIDATNAPEFLRAGAVMVAVGSALADPSQLDKLSALL